ncbi:MAG: formyltetrahydrofolate deformylase [Alphaproteobacteria bacterium]|nr:formyltetrahydrofolate deformylase [Alphaproteobacteria bacterium]
MKHLILNLSCPDQAGIVAATTQVLAQAAMNISESHQYGDKESGQFFMRIALEAPAPCEIKDVQALFAGVAKTYKMDYAFYEASSPELAVKPKVVIMVSKFDHCLHDLIYRTRIGSLDMDIVAIISNHPIDQNRLEATNIPFHYWQDPKENEKKLRALLEAEQVELVILARYMQILSADLVQTLAGRIINIHHSFLPSFKGAEPYSRAYERGVKMIGATAHFVTADLDEGPIITQGVANIRHDMGVSDLVDVGRDVERRTLAHAVKLYLQRRILLNGKKTVVFE